MNNRQVAHLWANQSRQSAKGSNFYFEGDTIYSYGRHFPIARVHKSGLDDCVLFTRERYSVTTSKHISYARQACSHKLVFHVVNPLNEPSKADVDAYNEEIETLLLKAVRSRVWGSRYLEYAEERIKEANAFCDSFGFKTRFKMPGNMDTIKEKAKKRREEARKREVEHEKRRAIQNAKLAQEWLDGASFTLPHDCPVMLRARNGLPVDTMETSKGATVPLNEAKRAYRFAMSKRSEGWHRNGQQFQVGEFQLEAVNEFGVIAGCHRIAWSEIERFAKVQGWA